MCNVMEMQIPAVLDWPVESNRVKQSQHIYMEKPLRSELLWNLTSITFTAMDS